MLESGGEGLATRAVARRTRRRDRVAVSVAVIAALIASALVVVPAAEAAQPSTPNPSPTPAAPAPVAADVPTSEAVAEALRDATVVTIQVDPNARERIDELLADALAKKIKPPRVTPSAPAPAPEPAAPPAAAPEEPAPVDAAPAEPTEEELAAARAAEAQRQAEAQLREALEALARALSTDQCVTVGGTDGQPASISCPLPNNAEGTITGEDGTTVTTDDETDDETQALVAASVPETPVDASAALTDAQLADALDQAKAEWAAAGGDASAVSASIADLGGAQLAENTGTSVVVDLDAAGWGWSAMDLLTVVRHELGHALGLEHGTTALMAETLAPGETHAVGFPEPARADEVDPTPPTETETAAPTEVAPSDEAAATETNTDTTAATDTTDAAATETDAPDTVSDAGSASTPAAASESTPSGDRVLVSAEHGGTVTVGNVTITFAPGALAADAYIVVTSESRGVAGLHATSPVFDLRAYDAATGAEIHTFLVDPTLTVAVPATASSSSIYYVASDDSLEQLATTYDAATGTLSASLPHFSLFTTGTPLDGLVGAIVPILQQYIADALSGPRTKTLDDVDLGVLALESLTV